MKAVWLSLVVLFSAAFPAPAAAWTELKPDPNAPSLAVERSRSAVVQADTPFSMIVVSNPEIAEAKVTTNRSFLVRGKSPGWTTVVLYDEEGMTVEMFDVRVSMGLDSLREDFQTLIPNEPIEVHPILDGVYLEGRLSSAKAVDKALQVAERHVPGGVANGLTTAESQQVLLEVRFVEASRDVIREIGFGASFDANDVAGATEGGLVSGLASKAVATFTGVGGENLDITIRALETKGLLRTLAKPNLVALSGDTASFLAGGEFPIPVAGDDQQITIQFREFGVSLAFSPTVLGDGLVNLRVRPEVSSLDFRNAVRSGGVSVPALSVRRAETSIELRDGQAFAIAGLLQNSFNADAINTPGLSDLPVIGALFSSKRFQSQETELVIIVTPRLVQPAPTADALKTPNETLTEPSAAEFFLLNETGLDPAGSPS